MFSDYVIPAALLHLLCCLLYGAGEEVIRLQELEGNTVTIHTGGTGVQNEALILWTYRSENVYINIVNSLIIRGEIITDYNRDKFRDRLQLDRNSGSLTISNISREDSGVYKLQVISGNVADESFSVNVYAPVSKPIVRNQAEERSVSHRESCSPLCSVENGKDVNLSWYEGEERISSITSTDSSERLYLPLNITHLNCSTYTCVAANPVSNQTTQLNITEFCYKAAQNIPRDHFTLLIAVLIVAGLIAVIMLSIFFFWKNKPQQQDSQNSDLNYIDVEITIQNSNTAHTGNGVGVTGLQEESTSVEYSTVR